MLTSLPRSAILSLTVSPAAAGHAGFHHRRRRSCSRLA
jgi:hypothetical protein